MSEIGNKKSVNVKPDFPDFVGRKMVATILALAVILICFASVLSGGEASVGGYTYTENPTPTAFKVIFSIDGAISIFAPVNTPGHWEVGGGEVFSDQSNALFFCPLERFGIEKFTFVPDDSRRCESSVYAIMCRL